MNAIPASDPLAAARTGGEKLYKVRARAEGKN